MFHRFLTKSRSSRSGNVLVWSILLTMVGIATIYYLNSQVVVKSQQTSADRKKRRSRSILEALHMAVLKNIKSLIIDNKKCSLDPLIVPSSTAWMDPKVTAPADHRARFPMEQIYMEEFDENNQPTGRFETVEENPTAYITHVGHPTDANYDPGLYLIVEQAKQCPHMVRERNYLPAPIPQGCAANDGSCTGKRIATLLEHARSATELHGGTLTEIPWAAPCQLGPGEKMKLLEYRTFFNVKSLVADYYIYFSRSRFPNMAFYEPNFDDDQDQESLITGQEKTGNPTDSTDLRNASECPPNGTCLPGATGYRMSGSNHEQVFPPVAPQCSKRFADLVNYVLDTVSQNDPCARVATYMVGGAFTGTQTSLGPVDPTAQNPYFSGNVRCIGGGQNGSGGGTGAPVAGSNGGVGGPRCVARSLNSTVYGPPVSLSTSKAQVLTDLLGPPGVGGMDSGCNGGMCLTIPAGVVDFRQVLYHYHKYHQPALSSLLDSDKSTRRVLLFVGDGLEMGRDLLSPEDFPSGNPDLVGLQLGSAYNLSDIRYMDIYSNANCGPNATLPLSNNQTKFYIETNGITYPTTRLADGTNQYIFPNAGLSAFQYGTLASKGTAIVAGNNVFRWDPGQANLIEAVFQPFWGRTPSMTGFGVRSVIRAEDGACIDIVLPDPDHSGFDQYQVSNYPYRLQAPASVSLTSDNLQTALQRYNPYRNHTTGAPSTELVAHPIRLSIIDTAASASIGLNADLRNGFGFFPFPRVDLDELAIFNLIPNHNTFMSSQRIINFTYLQPDELATSFANIFHTIQDHDDQFSEGTAFYGIGTPTSRDQ